MRIAPFGCPIHLIVTECGAYLAALAPEVAQEGLVLVGNNLDDLPHRT